MKILINARLLTERKGGPYRYLVNILNELAIIDKKNEYILFLNERLTEDFNFLNNSNFRQIIYPFKNKLIFDYICLPVFSYLNRIDIYFFPKNTFSPMIRGKKIAVYHDIVYFEKMDFREFKYFDNLHHKVMIPIDAKFTSADLAVSNFTADRMEKLLKIKKNKITVIHEGVEESFKQITDSTRIQNVIDKYNIQQPFLFFAGSLSPRKNIITILKAFDKIKDLIPHRIYFTAGDSWNDSHVFEFIKSNKLDDRIIRLGFLPEEDLVTMYNLSDCYLYPSLYEGFGLPILEAQSCGCPVITSNVSSCPEIAGEGAVVIDPYNTDELSKAILKIVNDVNFKKDLIKKGFDNVKRFSWKRAAREHLDLFNKVNDESGSHR